MIGIVLAAVLIGAIAASRLGLRPGMTAAVVAGVAFLAAAVIPGIRIWVYLAAGVVTAGLWFSTPRAEAAVVTRTFGTLKKTLTTLLRKRSL